MHRVAHVCIGLTICIIQVGCHSIQSRPDRNEGLPGLLGLKRQNEGNFQDDLLTNVDPMGTRSFNRLLIEDLS
ncbi:MAG: hypothetical protein AAGA30_19305, partial [Planctomycetota bacterium]